MRACASGSRAAAITVRFSRPVRWPWKRGSSTIAPTLASAVARSAGAQEVFELFTRYGARDFRDIGHKAIFVANSWRTLQVIGWQHAEPVLRSLAYALLERGGAKENPAKADLPADRPFRQNIESVKKVREGWLDGRLVVHDL